jgi:hypothetical protein
MWFSGKEAKVISNFPCGDVCTNFTILFSPVGRRVTNTPVIGSPDDLSVTVPETFNVCADSDATKQKNNIQKQKYRIYIYL